MTNKLNDGCECLTDDDMGLVGRAPAFEHLRSRLRKLAGAEGPVLISGETGTGKELVAHAIHRMSPRKHNPFVAVNCGSLTDSLFESELFGHERGAFTDAHTRRPGLITQANGGTLFLDEVGDMPMSTQIKLLRVLEDHQITRVGDNKPIRVNVRLISASNRSLEEMVAQGKFRNDLYFRLKVVTVHLPALRERREDIIPLADHFRRQFSKRHHKPIKGLSPVVSKRLYGYDWPGNVRQLRNALETMVVLDLDGTLDADDLPPELADVPPPSTGAAASGGPIELIGRTMDDIERWAIEQTLQLTNGNREEAAKILQIGARTLYRKLEKYQSEATTDTND
jgi:DNA-binding NtrC family response regulator